MTAGAGDEPTETCLQLYWSIISGVAGPPAQRKISFRPKMARKCLFLAERMHERFVGSLTTAGVGDGPTETCLQLYESNISGVAGPPAQKKNQFLPKNGQKLPIFCRKNARHFCRMIDNRQGRGRTH